jgi:hypothetical protein
MRDLVEKFRKALDEIDWQNMPDGFKNFPSGTCGDISDILAVYLYEQGFTNIEYVCGENERGSHAWLEIDGTAIDITADQFDDVSCSVIIQSPEIWHSEFTVTDRRKAGYKDMNGPAIADIMRVDSEVLKKLVTTHLTTNSGNSPRNNSVMA